MMIVVYVEAIVAHAYGKRINQLEYQKGKQGSKIRITLDTEVQKLCAELMDGKAGSISVMDIYTGEVIALSSLNNAHNTIFIDVLKAMKKNKLQDVLLVGGGIIPKNDVSRLEKLGVGKLFGPGTPVQETIDYITDWVNKNRR